MRKLNFFTVSEEVVRISSLILNLFFLKRDFSFHWYSMMNKMLGSCLPVGGMLEVVHETRNEEKKQTGPEHTMCSPLIRVTTHSCS